MQPDVEVMHSECHRFHQETTNNYDRDVQHMHMPVSLQIRVYIKFHQNPPSWSTVVPSERTDTTKLIVAGRNFANEPQNSEGGEGNYVNKCSTVY